MSVCIWCVCVLPTGMSSLVSHVIGRRRQGDNGSVTISPPNEARAPTLAQVKHGMIIDPIHLRDDKGWTPLHQACAYGTLVIYHSDQVAFV
jgi:hypothetical protein